MYSIYILNLRIYICPIFLCYVGKVCFHVCNKLWMWYLNLFFFYQSPSCLISMWVINISWCFIHLKMVEDYCILVILWHILKEAKSTDVNCVDVPTSANSTLCGTCASSAAKRRSSSARSALTNPDSEKHWKYTSLWSTQTLK